MRQSPISGRYGLGKGPRTSFTYLPTTPLRIPATFTNLYEPCHVSRLPPSPQSSTISSARSRPVVTSCGTTHRTLIALRNFCPRYGTGRSSFTGESIRPDANVADLSLHSSPIPSPETSRLLASSARQQLWRGRAEVSDALEGAGFVRTSFSTAKRTSTLTQLETSPHKTYEKVPTLPWL